MAAKRSGGKPSKKVPRIALTVAGSLGAALVIAALAHVAFPPGAPTVGPSTGGPGPTWTVDPTERVYSIDPAPLTLTQADVGSHLVLVTATGAGPTQKTLFPLPYQEQYYEGSMHNFIVDSALNPPGRTELENYQTAHGFQPTNPPTIFGAFVADHTGIFNVTAVLQSYHVASAARVDYHCCVFNTGDNYDNLQSYPIVLGDESTAWGGIRRSPTNPPQEYEEQTFFIHWRRGPIEGTVFVFGAHDVTFDEAAPFARIVDQRIASALQEATEEPSDA